MCSRLFLRVCSSTPKSRLSHPHITCYHAFSIFRVALSIHNLVYSLCRNCIFHGIGCESFPSGDVFTKIDFRWNVAICAASSVLTSIEKRPSDGRWSAFNGESPQRTITYHSPVRLAQPKAGNQGVGTFSGVCSTTSKWSVILVPTG
jgi:hypothetical protein